MALFWKNIFANGVCNHKTTWQKSSFIFYSQDQCNDGAEFVDAVNVSNNLQKVEQGDLLFEELLEQDIAPKIDCDQCLLIPNAFCLAESRNDPNSVRMPFDDMIETMTEKKSVCTCSDGYLPVFDDDGILSRCHDPIMATAIIGKVKYFFPKWKIDGHYLEFAFGKIMKWKLDIGEYRVKHLRQLKKIYTT